MTSLAALALTVLAIAWAGLAPLEFDPPNGATWLEPGPGLAFAREGIAYGAEPFAWSAGGRSYAIDVWFEPGEAERARVARLLAVQDAEELPLLSVAQWRDALIVRDRITTPNGRLTYREYSLDGAIEPGRARHLTIVSDTDGLRAYLEGEPTALDSTTPGLAVGEELSGRLVLGNAPRGNQEWSGRLRAVAFSAGALSPAAVARRHRAGAREGARALLSEPGLIALYAFEEGHGRSSYDLAQRAPKLRVPPHYQPLRRSVLRWPDRYERRSAGYLSDLAWNLVGFVPAGFFGALTLYRLRRRHGVALWAAATGLALGLSLAIEGTQVWLPGRVSSLSDLVSNGAGGALGAALAVFVIRRKA